MQLSSSRNPNMTTAWKSYHIIISAFLCVYMLFQMRSTLNEQTLHGSVRDTFETSTGDRHWFNRSIMDTVTDKFCHSDEGIVFQKFKDDYVSTRNCIGYCRHRNPKISTFLGHAIVAPHISSLCLMNPFHGFYDCIWPLLHYLVTCSPLRRLKHPPAIVINNGGLSEESYSSWVVQAQMAFLQNNPEKGLILERNRIPRSQCVCFTSLVRFERGAFWRPIRYQFKYETNADTILSSHPMETKRNGLIAFREIILSRLHLNSRPLRVPYPSVLVYGREDINRRTWCNVGQFIKLLRKKLFAEVHVLYIKRIPINFEEQVSKFNAVSLLIAPHGAAMVNTLFMRPGSAVLEISSKHCFQGNNSWSDSTFLDTDTIANVSDPNSWVPWHAQSLGIYHVTASCTQAPGRARDFETDNESLLHLAIMLLTLVDSSKH